MRRARPEANLLFLFCLFAGAAPAAAEALNTSAEHAIIMDGDTGQVLWASESLQTMWVPQLRASHPKR